VTALGADRLAEESLWVHAAGVLIKGFGFLAGVAFLAVRVLPAVARHLARSPELLVLSGIAWAVALSAAAETLELSQEVGAFVAGASLASTPYREALGSRLVTVRDFLLLFFFIDLGARLDLTLLGATFGDAVLLSLFVLVGNPLIVMVIMGWMGYRKRTSLLTGLAVAQISEFSLILGALGVSAGHISAETMGLVTTVGLITIGLSTYMIMYSGPLYERMAPWLGLFERRLPYREATGEANTPEGADALVIGLGRYGGGIVHHLLLRGRRVIGVDFDPQTLDHWRGEGVPVVYGDASDPDLFDHLPLEGVGWVVSTAPEMETSRILLRHLKERGFRGQVAIAARSSDEGDSLRQDGASVVLRPYADAAEQAADAITTAMDRLSAIASATPGLGEVRLGSASMWAGHLIADIPLRDEFGVTVLAVSRGGRSVFNPGPTFQLFPGDRVFLSGDPAAVTRAIAFLAQSDAPDPAVNDEGLEVAEVLVGRMPKWTGQRLVDLALPATFGVTVLAVIQDDVRSGSPDPYRTLTAADRLVLAGTRDNIARVRGTEHASGLDV